MSAEKVRSRDKEQNQDQKAVIMADDIERVEEDAKHAENEVLKKKQDYLVHKTSQFINPSIKSLYGSSDATTPLT